MMRIAVSALAGSLLLLMTLTIPAQDSSNRWDGLAQRDICAWLPTAVLEEELGLAVTLTQKKEPSRCDYRFKLPDGYPERAFSLYVEVHDDLAYLRSAETSMAEGFTGSLFTPFDPGTPDLNVYVSNKDTYLYVYPDGGTTLWRLEYLADPAKKKALFGSASPPESLGREFIRILVQVNGNQIWLTKEK